MLDSHPLGAPLLTDGPSSVEYDTRDDGLPSCSLPSSVPMELPPKRPGLVEKFFRTQSLRPSTPTQPLLLSSTLSPPLPIPPEIRPGPQVVTPPPRPARTAPIHDPPAHLALISVPKRPIPKTSMQMLGRLHAILMKPASLRRVLAELSWEDLCSLHDTCSKLRRMLERLSPMVFHVLLERFISGYQYNKQGHGTLSMATRLHIRFRDIESLVLSQQRDLATYPSTGIAVLARPGLNPETEPLSAELIHLTSIHSKFVILLRQQSQELQHSDRHPSSQGSDWHMLEGVGSSWYTLSHAENRLPELKFPTPLSYFPALTPDYGVSRSSPRKKLGHDSRDKSSGQDDSSVTLSLSRSSSTPSKIGRNADVALSDRNSRRVGVLVKRRPPQPLRATNQVIARHRRDLSALRGSASPGATLAWGSPAGSGSGSGSATDLLSPDGFESSTAKYSGGRTHMVIGTTPRMSHPRSSPVPTFTPSTGSDNSLARTHPSESSRLSSSGVATVVPVGTPLPNPHALMTAVETNFAPILRVYVPCTELDADVLHRCQGQLVRARVWGSLNVGDIIVNLGYVPLSKDHEQQQLQPNSDDPVWLIYNGSNLVPFNPRRSPPPLSPDDPRMWNSLDCIPCPTYYLHIIGKATSGSPEAGFGMSIDPLHKIVLPTSRPSVSPWRRRAAVTVPNSGVNGRFPWLEGGVVSSKVDTIGAERVDGPQVLLPSQKPSSLGEEEGKDVEFSLIELKSDVVRSRALGPVRVVNRFVWIARFEVHCQERQSMILERNGENLGSGGSRSGRSESGEGWVGEWIVEADGTPEGKNKLCVALEGRESFLWKIVLDRCAPGVVWLRLTDEP